MSTLIARKLAKRAGWLPHGANEHMNLRAGRYWAGRKEQSTPAAAFAAAGFTFARPSQASRSNAAGQLVYETAGTPRLDYHPATLAPLGLLLERAMTPLIANTEALDNAYWTKTLSTVSANQDVAPDSAATGDRLIPNATTSSGIQLVNATVVTLASGTKYAMSGYARADGSNGVPRVTFGFSYSTIWHGGWYSLVSRTAGATQNAFAGFQTMAREGGGGWLRCMLSHVTATTSQRVGVQPASSDGTLPFTGDGTKYASIWGLQLEQGDFATSYNAGVARAADSLTRPASGLSRFTRVIGFIAPLGLSTNVIWQMDGGSEANRVRLVRDTAGAVRLIATVSGSEVANLALGIATAESFNRVAVAYDGTTYRAVMNANPVMQTATAALPTVTTERLGSSSAAGEELCGWLGEFTSYDSLADGGLREASRVFPAWVPTDASNAPAKFFADFVNGRFWWNGTVYPTQATLVAAMGGTDYGPADIAVPWANATFAILAEGLAGSAPNDGADYTIATVDNDGTTQYQRLYFSAGQNALGITGYDGAPFFGYENSVLYGKFNTFRVAGNFKVNDYSVSFQGGTAATDTAGAVMRNPARLRIGNDYTRTKPFAQGGIWKVALFDVSQSSSQVVALANANYPLIGAGDSYMGGAGNVGVQQSIARLRKRLMLNVGVGGSTLASQVAPATAAIAAWPNAIFIHQDGDPNGYGATLADDLANYATVVDAVLANGHSKYVLVAPMPRGGQTVPQRQRARDLYTALAAAYPGHVVDPLPIVLALADPVADAADVTANQCPSSQMQDGVHLVEAAMDAVVLSGVLPLIDANGWLPAE